MPTTKPNLNPLNTAKKFPTNPKHPERNCWGCDTYCPANDMRCGNGSERTQHPIETLGENWLENEKNP